MKIIKKSSLCEVISYYRAFSLVGQGSCGFHFPCDQNGNIEEFANDSALNNYKSCLSGEMKILQNPEYKFNAEQQDYVYVPGSGSTVNCKIIDDGIVKYEHSYKEPAIGECNYCRREVVLSGFTNTCECGIDYNWGGQELAPREQWGDDTQETLGEILSIP